MITVSVPDQSVADAIGDLGEDARIVVWDPREDEAPDEFRDDIDIVCLPHLSARREIYARVGRCAHASVIQIPSAGYEHVVKKVPAGRQLANARGVHDSRTAEMALTLALVSQRRIPQFLEQQRAEIWDPQHESLPPSVADRRVLVVGYGSIGSAIGERFRACEAHVEGVARSPRTADDGTIVHGMDELPALVSTFDIVVLVTPLTEDTDNLVDEQFLATMHDDSLLINVGRGKVVDTDALVAELLAGRLRAGLDVTDPEPLPEGHPLWNAPGCVLMPHVAGFASLTDRRYVDLVRRQVDAMRHGEEPVNLVFSG